jgi:hypothetical protein
MAPLALSMRDAYVLEVRAIVSALERLGNPPTVVRLSAAAEQALLAFQASRLPGFSMRALARQADQAVSGLLTNGPSSGIWAAKPALLRPVRTHWRKVRQGV